MKINAMIVYASPSYETDYRADSSVITAYGFFFISVGFVKKSNKMKITNFHGSFLGRFRR